MNINVDKPIETMDEDVLGRTKFVTNLVEYITSYKGKESLTIGLYGKWGSGKTSIINLASKKFDSKKYKIVNFNPWNFKGQDELLQCFFKELYIQLDMVNYHKLFTKLGNFFKRVGQVLSFGKYVPTISPFATIIAPLIKDYGETLNNLTYDKSLEKIKDKISNALSKLDKKIVVFIDDVDRLNDNEICQIFQLVKLLGNFENVIYVLSMDKDVVVSALQNSQKEHAEIYLEKIVQLPLNIPEVSTLRIQAVLIENLNKICVELNKFLPTRNNDLARTGFWQQFATLRDVNRFLNVFNLKFESLKKNIDFHDFCLITLLELKFPYVYKFIKNNKSLLSGNYSQFDRDDGKRKEIKNNIDGLFIDIKNNSEEDLIFIRETLEFLFPKVSQVNNKFWGYTTYHYQEAKIRGFMYVEDNFDNYFQFNENELLYDRNQIAEIIETYDKEKFKELIVKLNLNKQLSSFMYYISYYIEHKLEGKRVLNILNWLMELSDELKKEKVEYDAFSIDCERQIGYIIKNYLKKNKETVNAYEFIKNIYSSGKISLTKVELLRSLQFENGRVSSSEEKNTNPILTIEETIQIENMIKDSLKEFVSNKENFDAPDYVQYYYLMKSIDKNFCEELSGKIIEDGTHVLKFIKNFCTHGQLLTGTGAQLYGFNQKLSEDFDLKKIYENLIKDFNNDMDLSEGDNKYKIAFIMSYENQNEDNSYSQASMEEYLKRKKTTK